MKKILAIIILAFTLTSLMGCKQVGKEIQESSDTTVTGSSKSQEGSSQADITPVLTKEQLAAEIAKSEGITTNLATEEIGQNINEGNNQAGETLEETFRIFSREILVADDYRPRIKFYCQTSEEGESKVINKVFRISFDRNYRGLTKEFNGHIYANLEDPTTIFYILNGDFYDGGITYDSSACNVVLGHGDDLTFTVQDYNEKFAYKYLEDKFIF
ncbi:hypothetical protein OZX60_06195 [Streptococcaceae bacterium ESL0687]|nr:hypothetical protein OZX60_06195 [Streptococcaceae bacterium ESL0687]